MPEFYKSMEEDIKVEHNWKANIYMSSLFLSKWHDKTDEKGNKVFEGMIEPVHTYVMNNFKST